MSIRKISLQSDNWRNQLEFLLSSLKWDGKRFRDEQGKVVTIETPEFTLRSDGVFLGKGVDPSAIPRDSVDVPREALNFLIATKIPINPDYRRMSIQERATAFTFGEITKQQVLQDTRTSLLKALSNGETFEMWKKQIGGKVKAEGWFSSSRTDKERNARLRGAFQDHMKIARAVGQWERGQRTKQFFPYYLYGRTTSTQARDEHLKFVGLLLPVDDAFWLIYFPPSDYSCKCSVRQITAAELKSRGGLSERPPIQYQTVRSKGQEFSVPKGTSPTFINPIASAQGRL